MGSGRRLYRDLTQRGELLNLMLVATPCILISRTMLSQWYFVPNTIKVLEEEPSQPYEHGIFKVNSLRGQERQGFIAAVDGIAEILHVPSTDINLEVYEPSTAGQPSLFPAKLVSGVVFPDHILSYVETEGVGKVLAFGYDPEVKTSVAVSLHFSTATW